MKAIVLFAVAVVGGVVACVVLGLQGGLCTAAGLAFVSMIVANVEHRARCCELPGELPSLLVGLVQNRGDMSLATFSSQLKDADAAQVAGAFDAAQAGVNAGMSTLNRKRTWLNAVAAIRAASLLLMVGAIVALCVVASVAS